MLLKRTILRKNPLMKLEVYSLMPELRQDPITDTWVIIATERSKRPSGFGDFSKEGKKEQDSCPFCVGNEQLTPP